jgi:hypothetical protein
MSTERGAAFTGISQSKFAGFAVRVASVSPPPPPAKKSQAPSKKFLTFAIKFRGTAPLRWHCQNAKPPVCRLSKTCQFETDTEELETGNLQLGT